MNRKTWQVWLVPGGVLLTLAAGLVYSPFFSQIAPSLAFFYFAVFCAGLFLAWRFHSSRVLFCLVTLLLAHRAVDFFSAGQVRSGPGQMALGLAGLLIPLNFVLFAFMRERGLTMNGIAPRAGVLFLESVIVAVLCRPENSGTRAHGAARASISVWLLIGFAASIAVFVWRYLQSRKPTEPGFAWATAGVFIWLQSAPLGKVAEAYIGTAALILAASLIETSYVLAYHDELTGIRGRRAFNEALPTLDLQYAIAIVDIDHFKKFNDTFGHDVGDQVLCMVAARISEVGGDGQAFRCGGEEFAIIFRELSAKDSLEHLESLRRAIEESMFRVRGMERRAAMPIGQIDQRQTDRKQPDRRQNDRRKTTRKRVEVNPLTLPPDRLSVTVSIGVAEPNTRYRQPEHVIQAADQALYRAKQKGRNRVELASTAPLHLEKSRRAKVSSP